MVSQEPENKALTLERWRLLAQIQHWFETPLVVLAFVWLILLVLDFTSGLSPRLERLTFVIWAIFIADFAIRFALAPHKVHFLKKNWLTVLALAVPALRVFRVMRAIRLLRVARAARGVRMVCVLGTMNRGMRALGRTMGRRGFGYVAGLTTIVLFAGAAGMYAFEPRMTGGLNSYGEAVWWTAMLITTIGSSYWPHTLEGRVLCFILSLYSLGILGYITAMLASFFIGNDTRDGKSDEAEKTSVKAIHEEIRKLREQIESLGATSSQPAIGRSDEERQRKRKAA